MSKLQPERIEEFLSSSEDDFLVEEVFRLVEQARAEERQRIADVLLETARKYRRVKLNGDAETCELMAEHLRTGKQF